MFAYLLNGHRELELASLVLFRANQVELAVKTFANEIGRRQSQAHASLVDVLLELEVSKEHKAFLLHLLVHANAGIRDGD